MGKGESAPPNLFPNITRRDFCQGIAVSVVGLTVSSYSFGNAGSTKKFSASLSQQKYYPPSLTGMRGSHPGSFEVAHQLSWQHKKWPSPSGSSGTQSDSEFRSSAVLDSGNKPKSVDHLVYDLVIVGAGISGLATAYFYQQQLGKDKKILLLDNHDDFGGHAKRNEFTVGNNKLIGYGGSENVYAPATYSKQAKQLLLELGFETKPFYTAYDDSIYTKNGLSEGLFFNAEDFSQNKIVSNASLMIPNSGKLGELKSSIKKFPLSEIAKKELFALFSSKEDYLPGKSLSQKNRYLENISYRDYLLNDVKVSQEVADLFQRSLADLSGVGAESVPANYFYWEGFPGFVGLNLEDDNLHTEESVAEEPYIFHFPDGNASIARLLVRKLIPQVAKGHSMHDIVTATFNYQMLDVEQHPVKIRLNSTAVKVENHSSNQLVDVTYINKNTNHEVIEKVTAKKVVLACYNQIIPHLCPGLPEQQKLALSKQEKIPLLYTNVAIKNWRAFQKAGVSQFFCPGEQAFYQNVFLDFPVSLGDYQFSKSPDEPIIVVMWKTPLSAHDGLTAREQFRKNRYEIYDLTFEEIELNVRNQLQNMLAPFGFNHLQDIEAITVNRWPHGYAYEYNSLFDKFSDNEPPPHLEARKSFGGIYIANSDSEAFAYVNGAIDAAYRVVTEIHSSLVNHKA